MNRRIVVGLLVLLGLVALGTAAGVLSSGAGRSVHAGKISKQKAKSKRGKRKSKKKKKRGKAKVAKSADSRMPNVLIVVWDTARADHMSLYGHSAPTTPALEQFAREARVFEHAISPATWTVPAHASLFTGLPVTAHGANASWRWVDHHNITLAEHLSANGYATYAYSANPYVSGMTNMLQGFGTKRYSWEGSEKKLAVAAAKAKLITTDASTEISPAFQSTNPNVAWGHSTFKEVGHLANEDLSSWLKKRKDKDRPWFAFLNLMEAHSPRIPRMDARTAVMGDPALIELGLKTDVSLWSEVSAILGKHSYTDRELDAVRGVYDASILELDRAFSELIGRLEQKGALDRTIVILTSDHGESLGEHGLWEHRYGVWNTLVHVPLLIRYPEGMQPGRVAEPVTTSAIFPTVLDLIGLEGPKGVSLRRSLRRRKPDPAVFTQLTDPYTSKLGPFKKAYPDVDFGRFIRTYDAMYEGGQKLVRSSTGEHELYDLLDDPEELDNLYARHPEAAAYMERLERWRDQIPVADPSKRVAGDTKKGRGQKTEAKAMQKMLESLGYIEEDE